MPLPTSPAGSNKSAGPRARISMPASTESSSLSEARTPSSSVASNRVPIPTPDERPSKRQKLTFAEKEVQRAVEASQKEAIEKKNVEVALAKEHEKLNKDLEKRRKVEAKEQAKKQKDFEKAEKEKAREADRQVKDEARRKKEEEKQVKEAEKLAKEDAKRRKEEEKSKHEKSQLRLASFFKKPAENETRGGSASPSSRRSSVVSHGGGGEDHGDLAQRRSSPLKKSEAKDGFLPFFVMQHVAVAPVNQFWQDEKLQNIVASRLDQCMQGETAYEEKVALAFRGRKRKRCQRLPYSMRQMVEQNQGTSAGPIQLPHQATSGFKPSHVPYKVLSFAEDVRPPYKGTYTRVVPPNSALKLSRRPFTRQLPETDYDYDSEAEWEPPNEGDEDLDSGDDESDAGEEGADDMDGFLDDEDDRGAGRRKQQLLGGAGGGDMVPISSGLCWVSADNERKGPLEEYRIQPLSDQYRFPIDPFSTAYWPKSQQAASLLSAAQGKMQPPARLPLSSLNSQRSAIAAPPSSSTRIQSLDGQTCKDPHVPGHSSVMSSDATTTLVTNHSHKPLKCVPDDVLPAFKNAVQGSDLTKAGLIEVLKKQFPRLSKDAIKNTLGQVAVRQGVREADKKWVLAASVDVEGRHWTWRSEPGSGIAGAGAGAGIGSC